jgi:long-subunit acyl-CoA synthetase (AMP-forming)
VLGYYKDEKATRDTFTPDGWVKTGDRFRVDETGVF